MASPLVEATMRSPGFLGLNTEHAAAGMQTRWATELDNAVFDESGKISCRKGFANLVDGTPDTVHCMEVYRRAKGDYDLYCVGDATGTPTLYKINAWTTFQSKGTVNTTDAYLFNCNGKLIILDEGYTPKYFTTGGSATDFAAATGTVANPTSGIGASAFGRLFVVSEDRKTVHGSELDPDPSAGINWDNWYIDTTGNTGGSAKDGWTLGQDYITAVGAIDSYLVIFGRETIMMFQGINGTVSLFTSIVGVGCVNQRTLVHTGNDLLFMSRTGVRSLRRTIQYETAELDDASTFVRTDFVSDMDADTAVAVYDPQNAFYLISDGVDTYCFDTKSEDMPGGALRCSKWSIGFTGMAYDSYNNRLFLGRSDIVGEYTGYTDNSLPYKFTMQSAWLDFGRPNLKIIKHLTADIYGADDSTPKFMWAYDFNPASQQHEFAEAISQSAQAAEWSGTLVEWGDNDEWGGYSEKYSRRSVQGSGAGRFVRYGIEFIVNGAQVGVQQITISAKLGKVTAHERL